MSDKIGEQFQQQTKYTRGKIGGGPLDWANKPAASKSYPGAPKVRLSHDDSPSSPSLWEIIARRRSVRGYNNQALGSSDLSRLLWAMQGITGRAAGFEFRAAPSAGALYPVETYVITHRVDNVPPGLYHYGVAGHELEQLKTGDLRLEIAKAALDQDMAYTAAAVFVWSAVFARSIWKYKQRAFRYVYLDAGHIAENLALAAVALGLGSCQIAALYDGEVNDLLGLDGQKESVIYMSAVGHPL